MKILFTISLGMMESREYNHDNDIALQLRNGGVLNIDEQEILDGRKTAQYPKTIDDFQPILIKELEGSNQVLKIGRILDGIGFLRYDFIVEDKNGKDEENEQGPPGILVFLDESDRSTIESQYPNKDVFDERYQTKWDAYTQYMFQDGERNLNLDHRLVTKESSLTGSELLKIVQWFFAVSSKAKNVISYDKITINHVSQKSVIEWLISNGFSFRTEQDKTAREQLLGGSAKYKIIQIEDSGHGFGADDLIVDSDSNQKVIFQMSKKLK